MRVRLAQVLVRNPDLVLFGEPFSGLDSSSCQEMKELLLALAQRGKSSGRRVADRNGRVAQCH
jgi:ABC-type multidrug transport system ATPase subunit